MDQIKLQEEEIKIEEYFEDKRVYEVFKSMMKELTINRPENPLDFLIEKLQKKQPRRIFINGMPGSNRKEIALSVADHYGTSCISVGDILDKEVNKKSKIGKEISNSKKKYQFVRDDIVIDLVKPYIKECEEQGNDWIIEGFPRTMVQAVSL